ncbi:MAG TPA: hypothetical protein DCG57_00135, partial [Candidatus Riflebacteria bacterium]|nr:hypothetical protein [Candidatus Riflebacteria bacterium]
MGQFSPLFFVAAARWQRLHGCRSLCCRFSGLLLLTVFCLLLPPAIFAINAPTVTHIAGKAVVPDTTMYSNTSAFEVRGNAEAGAQIRLYRGAVQIATSTADAGGFWVISLPAQSENSYIFSAVAFDGLFISEASVSVPVIVDITPPVMSVQYGSSGCRSGSKYQCNNIGYIRAIVSDARSGVDFSTADIVVDYVTVPSTGDPDDYVVPSWNSLPGYIDNNGTNEVNYYSNTGFGTINQNYRKIRILAKISDRAGNQRTVDPVIFYNNARENQLAAVVEKIWDPDHNVFTGIGETAANIADVGGWVDYFEGMTVATNPIKIKARAQKWSLTNKSFNAWDVYDATFNRAFSIDQSTGEFILNYPILSYGDVTLTFGPRGGDCRPGQYSYVKIKTLQGAPYPIKSHGPYSGEVAIIGSRVWPTFTGKVYKMPFNQTVQVGFGDYDSTTWQPRLSQVILPMDQTCLGTPGIYDHGDVWYDANNDGEWNTG